MAAKTLQRDRGKKRKSADERGRLLFRQGVPDYGRNVDDERRNDCELVGQDVVRELPKVGDAAENLDGQEGAAEKRETSMSCRRQLKLPVQGRESEARLLDPAGDHDAALCELEHDGGKAEGEGKRVSVVR